MSEDPKKCERCDKPAASKKDRFCKECVKIVREEMKAAGYLKHAPRIGTSRAGDQKENTWETKNL